MRQIKAIRIILWPGLTFPDNIEFEKLTNKGNFLERLGFLTEVNDDINQVLLKNDPLTTK